MEIIFTEIVREPSATLLALLMAGLIGSAMLFGVMVERDDNDSLVGKICTGGIAVICILGLLCEVYTPFFDEPVEHLYVNKDTITVEDLLKYEVIEEYDNIFVLEEK